MEELMTPERLNLILLVLLALSELLGSFDKVKSNGIFQLIKNAIVKLVSK